MTIEREEAYFPQAKCKTKIKKRKEKEKKQKGTRIH
jgi:hypothetical protein